MKLSCLMDNVPLNDSFQSEHGLSLHIETPETSLLFDLGQSSHFIDNAAVLGINLNEADHVVLSHPHYDHVGGIEAFLAQNIHAKFYLNQDFLQETFFKFALIEKKLSIPLPPDLKLEKRLLFGDGSDLWEIAPHLFILKNFDRKYPQPQDHSRFYTKTDGGTLLPDSFSYEQVLIYQSAKGLIVITGCAHNGILNIVEKIADLFPQTPIHAVIGGFHLSSPSIPFLSDQKQFVRTIAKQLQTYPVDFFYTNHCTGEKAYQILRSVLGEKMRYLSGGEQIIF